MIHFLYAILKSQNPNVFMLKVLLYMFIIYLIYYFLNRQYCMRYGDKEGFTQRRPYILKSEQDIYDGFYSSIYSKLHKPEHRIEYELMEVIKATQPTHNNSVFLDIGSGTGDLVNILVESGYSAYGIDKSKAMVDISKERNTNEHTGKAFKCGDALEPMMFERDTFTHVICTYFTIYHFEDKRTLLRNMHSWLKPNGYCILHLVEPLKYDTITPIAKMVLDNNPHDYETKRITDTIVKFPTFEYQTKYDFDKWSSKKIVKVKESFKDNKTGNIRENEQTLYMEEREPILKMAENMGFIIHSQFTLKECIDDPYQSIYILEKI